MHKHGLYYIISIILITLFGAMLLPVNNSGKVLATSGEVDPDLLIITPAEFSTALQPLMEHKDATGISTVIETLESIYSFFGSGDEPEKVKKAIKYYYDLYDIKYVMLVGDCNKFPVRWQYGHFVDHLLTDNTSTNDDQVYCASDFYYADLYDEFGVYNDWDADGDGLYGELYIDDISSDVIDCVPEVAVARVPAQNLAEVQTYVDKVIYYELNTHGADWFDNLLLIQVGWSEQLHAKESIATYLEPLGFDTTRMYASINASIYPGPTGIVPDPLSITAQLNSGYGFVSELYHGHPEDWDYLYSVDNVTTLTNSPKLPVIFSDACETAKFYGATIPYRNYVDTSGNTTFAQAVGSVGDTDFPIPDPIQPFDNVFAISEAFLLFSQNGAIAYYGSHETGEPWMHWVLDENFFKAYSLGYNILGDMWEYAIAEFVDYWNVKDLTADGSYRPVAKWQTPSRFLLLGDPSLRVGGIDREQMPPGTYWSRMFSADAAARDIVDAGDGYVVAGYWWDTGEYAFDYQTVLVKYDYDGNLIDSTTLSDPQYNGAHSIIHDDASGDLSVTGFKWFTDGPYTDPWVWMMTVNGTLDKQWEAVHGSPYPDRGNAIIPDGNGFIIGGWEGIGPISDVGSGYMIRTHSNGTLDWEIRQGVDPETLWLGAEIYSVNSTTDGGAILGTAGGMKKVSFASPPTLQWEGGIGEYFAAKQTSDGGYIGVGRKVVPSLWKTDPYGLLLTKLDATGAVTWSHADYGNSKPIVGSDDIDDVGYDVIEVSDGYVITGNTESWAYHGNGDLWVIKTDLSGNMEWDLVLGNDGYDDGRAILEASDGGYIITGRTSHDGASRIWTLKVPGGFMKPVASFTFSPPSPVFVEQQINFDASASGDPDGSIITYKWDFGDGTVGGGVSPSHTYHAPGLYNVTLYVLDNDGCIGSSTLSINVSELEIQWEKFYGDGRDWGKDITCAPDGGYVVAGINVPGSSNYGNIWAFKTDSRGNLVWNRTYAGSYGYADGARTVTIAQDGGYILGGFRDKPSAEIIKNREIWIMKLSDADGTKVWEKFYDYGKWDDEVWDIKWDGSGYICSGHASTDDDTRHYDMLLLKIDLNGDEVWHETYPDSGGESTSSHAVTPTIDGGYIITGGYSYQEFDGPFLTVKVKADHIEDWRTNTGSDSSKSSGFWVDQTADLGYIAAGSLDGDFGLLKYTPLGVVDWSKNWGWSTDWDFGNAAASMAGSGYIIVGQVFDTTNNWEDLYIVRTDDSGNLLWDWKTDTPTPTEGANGVITASDGSCVILGTRSPGTGSTWLFKLGPNTPPNADFTYTPPSPVSGNPVNFDASASFDEDGDIVAWEWDFGNGDTGSGETTSYSFPNGGTYDVTLTVVDDQGGVGIEIQSVSVTQGLTVDFVADPTSGEAPLEVQFYKSVGGGTSPYVYAWDLDGNGTTDNDTAYPVWTYTEPGVYTVSLEATDAAPTTKTETKVDYVSVSGITTSASVNITESVISEDPLIDPGYDPTGAPADIDWVTAKGFEITATGADGSYDFQIHFETPVTSGFELYKLPGWTLQPYTPIDDYTIQVTLEISGGILDPPFVLAGYGDGTLPTMDTITEAPDQYFTTAPILSKIRFEDNDNLHELWYQMDSFTGTWTELAFGVTGTFWEINNWTVPGFASLADGSHTIYFMATDDNGNADGESGEWSWQFNKGNPPTSPPASPPTGGGGGGGGGGGAGARGITSFAELMNPEGVLTRDVLAAGSDLQVYLTISSGTSPQGSAGGAIYWISVIAQPDDESLPPPPEGAIPVSPYYEMEPDGAIFDLPVTCTFSYALWGLPEGADADNLVVMWWDAANSQWVSLDSQVDPEKKTVTVGLSHFSLYAVMLWNRPAEFELNAFEIAPMEVEIEQGITISVMVTNTGDIAGIYDAVLMLNGNAAATKTITLNGHESAIVSFSLTPDTTGEYTVGIGDMSGRFMVKAPEVSSEPEPPPVIPASFTVSSLSVMPSEVLPDEEVAVSAVITNIGGTQGSYTAILKVNGNEDKQTGITLDAGMHETVTFSCSWSEAGLCTVSIGDATGQFTVTAPQPKPEIVEPVEALPEESTSNTGLIIGIVAAIIVIGLGVYYFIRRRQAVSVKSEK